MKKTLNGELEFVVVHGDGGSGKTLNKDALRRHFGCDVVVEGDDLYARSAIPKEGRVLFLTWHPRPRDPRDRRRHLEAAEVVAIEDAAEALGDAWVKPDRNFVPACNL